MQVGRRAAGTKFLAVSRVAAAARCAWGVMPDEIASSGATLRLQRRLDRLRGRPPRPRQKVIHTLDELDEVLAQVDVAAARSDDAARHEFRTFRMEVDYTLPDDP